MKCDLIDKVVQTTCTGYEGQLFTILGWHKGLEGRAVEVRDLQNNRKTAFLLSDLEFIDLEIKMDEAPQDSEVKRFEYYLDQLKSKIQITDEDLTLLEEVLVKAETVLIRYAEEGHAS